MSEPTSYGIIGVVDASQKNDVLDFIYKVRQERWSIEPLHQHTFCFYPPALHSLLYVEAWDLAHRLTERFGEFDPLIDEVADEQAAPDIETKAIYSLEERVTGLDPSKPDWSLRAVEVQEAWDYLRQHPRSAEADPVIIAHPDAGFKPHNELDGQILHELSRDFVGREHPMASHGVSTASVIISQDNRDTEISSVTGVAPQAHLIPMRVTYRKLGHEAILYCSGVELLTRAIYYAIDQDAHIISISLGFFGNEALHNAIKAAHDEDIIIIAAGSNYTWRFITWPARYPEVIAMAGCNANYKRWKFSARGAAIDAVGPGENVWCASFNNDGSYRVAPSDGTSFATAITAGIAALWLEHHGRDDLLKLCKVHNVKLGRLFLEVLKQTSTHQENFKHGDWGAGIVNANNVVRADLGEIISSITGRQDTKVEIEDSELATFKAQFNLTDAQFERIKDDALAKRELAFYHSLPPHEPIEQPQDIKTTTPQEYHRHTPLSAALKEKLGER